MKIQQAACFVKSKLGEFYGIVVFDAEKESAKTAVQELWGEGSFVCELDGIALANVGRNTNLPIFTANRLA